MLLVDYVADYCLRRDSSQVHEQQLQVCARLFSEFLGRDASLSDINEQSLNGWLAKMREDGLAAATRRNRRTMLLSLNSQAVVDGLAEPIARGRVAQVKVRPRVVEGFSYEEAQQVIERIRRPTQREHGRWLARHHHRTCLPRRSYWLSYLLACWDSAAPKDLRELRWQDVHEGGIVTTLRTKTGEQLLWKFSEATLEAMEPMRLFAHELIWPIWSNMSGFRHEARYVIQEIGGATGKSLGGFRAGAGTDVARQYGVAAGAEYLGHTNSRTFERHYLIRRLMADNQRRPRPLLPTA